MMTTNFGRIQVLLREGAAPMTSAPVRDPLAGELLRDWARPEAPAVAGIIVTDRLAKEQWPAWPPRP
jgi:hypothetical protein